MTFLDRETNTTREGADIDSENLRRVLSKLHFEVRLHQDKTRNEMRVKSWRAKFIRMQTVSCA